ncbi:MAG: hypothetical protein GYA59_02730 [Chloroflexi bacterium]|nr:hypothetical protein [Chloroflexota bacterium]
MDTQIAETFAAYFAAWKITLPADALVSKRPGAIRAQGWTIQYRFDADEKGEFLDFYATHRMTNDRHVRIHASGRIEHLLSYLEHVILPPNATAEQKRFAEQEFHEYNQRVTNLLRMKGFVPSHSLKSGRLLLVHWNEGEAAALVDELRAIGWDVTVESDAGEVKLSQWRQQPPKAVLISLRRLPSHGRELAQALRASQWGRSIPLVFFDGGEEKVSALRQQFPQAELVCWEELPSLLEQF